LVADLEYLVTHGSTGEFGRFRPVPPAGYRRGDRVVVRSQQGLAVGEVLCPVTPNHLQFLGRTGVGELLRIASNEDEHTVRASALVPAIFTEANRLASEHCLPLEILDVEVAVDGSQVIVHHLRRDDCDLRLFVSELARRFDMLVVMNNLVTPAEPVEEGQGCGKPDCGKGEGSCSSCGSGSGGGCSTGSCGKSYKAEEVTAYLLQLRQQVEARSRTPLI
jgi:PSP1 C-terminal conserved region